MIISKKEFEALKKKVDEQENMLNNMSFHLMQLQQELNELKNPKSQTYFG